MRNWAISTALISLVLAASLNARAADPSISQCLREKYQEELKSYLSGLAQYRAPLDSEQWIEILLPLVLRPGQQIRAHHPKAMGADAGRITEVGGSSILYFGEEGIQAEISIESLAAAIASGQVSLDTAHSPYNVNIPLRLWPKLEGMKKRIRERFGFKIEIEGASLRQDLATKTIVFPESATLHDLLMWVRAVKEGEPEVRSRFSKIKYLIRAQLDQELSGDPVAAEKFKDELQIEISKGLSGLSEKERAEIQRLLDGAEVRRKGFPALLARLLWKEYDADFQRTGDHQLKVYQSVYEKYRKSRHPGAAYLEKLGTWEGTIPKMPSMQRFITEYFDTMSKAVEEGIISKNDILTPARVLRRGEDFTWITWGEPIPEGWQLIPDGLPDPIFIKMIAERFFPSGENLMFSNGETSAIHDFWHLRAFKAYPRYMAAIQRAITQVATNGVENLSSDYRFQGGELGSPYFYVLEDYGRGNADSEAWLRKTLELPADQDIFKLDQEAVISIKRILMGHSSEKLVTIAQKLISEAPGFVELFGGVAGDIVLNHSYSEYHVDVRARRNPMNWLHRLNAMMGDQKGDLASEIALFAVYLVESSKIPPEEVVSTLLNPRYDPEARAFKVVNLRWMGTEFSTPAKKGQ